MVCIPSVHGFEAELALAGATAADDAATIARQNLEMAKLERQIYGPRSERTARRLHQIELDLEELESAASEDEIALSSRPPKRQTLHRSQGCARPASP